MKIFNTSLIDNQIKSSLHLKYFENHILMAVLLPAMNLSLTIIR